MKQRSLALLAVAGLLLAAGFVAAEEAAAADLSDAPKVEAGDAPQKTGTDAAAAEREAAGKMSSPGFQHTVRANAEKFEFQAEVTRLMDILIHSLYSNKDIFLRELISNASDALDKIRFLALTDKSLLGEGDTAKLDISIWADPSGRTLFIRDRGIGMTREELVKNLGTIAKSGTSAFLEAMQKGGDVNLIGQFGVGFYSVYLVADWVEVVTKAAGGKQFIWASGADGAFSVAEDGGENEDLGRGTLIKIHLKDGEEEYASQDKLKTLVARYSEFIDFPIYLQTTTEKDVPVDEEEGEVKEEGDTAAAEDKKDEEDDEDDDDDDGEVLDDEDESEGDKKDDVKTVKRNVTEWSHLNDNKAIWLRKAGEVPDEEYNKFYKAISKDFEDPLSRVHFKAEGDVEFKALLFVPQRAPWDFYDNIQKPKASSAGGPPGSGSPGLKLYVRRVFISDDVDELLPRWLSFVRGVVDSDSLPLNVNRETLQAHSSLKTIKKKLTRKVLDAIRRMADDEVKCEKADKKSEGEEEDEAKPSEEECKRYGTLWKEFGRALKLGIVEDNNNRGRLAKLLRFHSSKSPAALTSLDGYVSRLQPGQKSVYWMAGMTQDEVAASPFAEKLVAEGYEVVFLTDVLDEYVMQQLPEYEDLKFVNIAKEDIEHLDKDKDESGDESSDPKAKDKKRKAEDKALKEAFKPLTSWWKELLGDKVSNVKLSRRLASTPAVVVASKWGTSAHMERIMKASAFSDPSRAAMMKGQRSLEINPTHPLIVALKDKVVVDKDDAGAAKSAALLYETALLESGFDPEDPKAFTRSMYELMKGQLGVTEELPGAPTTPTAAGSSSSSSDGSSEEEGSGDKSEL